MVNERINNLTTMDFVIVQHKHHAPTPGLKSRRSAQAYGARTGSPLL